MRLRHAIFAAMALLLVSQPVRAEDEYTRLVGEAKAGRPVDYTAMRMAYAKSFNYDPYGNQTATMLQSLLKSKCPEGKQLAEQILAKVYTNLSAHMMLGFCAHQEGDVEKEAREQAVIGGLIKSIVQSGDGKTTATAIKVVSIDEEYEFLRGMKLRLQKQSLVEDKGHSYDRMEVLSPKEDKLVFFFNVDLPLEHMHKTVQANQVKK